MYYYDFDGNRCGYRVYVGYMITLNNPVEKGYTREVIRQKLEQFEDSLYYYCLADEIGENGTPHTHIYVLCRPATTFQMIKYHFPHGHIDKTRGTSYQARFYIKKEGDWKNTSKAETSIPDSFEEFGIISPNSLCRYYGIYKVATLLKQGVSNDKIFRYSENLAVFVEAETLKQQIKMYNLGVNIDA